MGLIACSFKFVCGVQRQCIKDVCIVVLGAGAPTWVGRPVDSGMEGHALRKT